MHPAVPPSLDSHQYGAEPHSVAADLIGWPRLPLTGEIPAPPTWPFDRLGRNSRTHSTLRVLRACTISGSLCPRWTASTRSVQSRFAVRLCGDSSRDETFCQTGIPT